MATCFSPLRYTCVAAIGCGRVQRSPCLMHAPWPSHRSDIPWCHGKSETRHATHAKYIIILYINIKYTRARGRRRHVPREPPIVDSRVRFYYSKANKLHATHPGSARALARALESSLLEGGAVTGVTSEPSRVVYWGGWGGNVRALESTDRAVAPRRAAG